MYHFERCMSTYTFGIYFSRNDKYYVELGARGNTGKRFWGQCHHIIVLWRAYGWGERTGDDSSGQAPVYFGRNGVSAVGVVCKCGLMTIATKQKVNPTHWMLPALDNHEIRVIGPILNVMTNLSKRPMVLPKHMFILSGTHPQERIVNPERNDG